MASKNSGREYMATSLRNGGRRAGSGVAYDDYSEESFGSGRVRDFEPVRFPHDGVNPEDLNGPVIIVKKGRGKNG